MKNIIYSFKFNALSLIMKEYVLENKSKFLDNFKMLINSYNLFLYNISVYTGYA